MSYSLNQKTLLTTLFTLTSLTITTSAAQALRLKVEVENLGPDGGVAVTPVWVGFHDGSFDSYDGGLPAERGLEQIAEDGNPMLISQDFRDNLTYVQGGVSGIFPSGQVGTRVDGMVGNSAIIPGTSAISMFDITPDDSNRWFSYVSMVLPSSDYYIANGNPVEWDLMPLFSEAVSSLSFNVGLSGTITDAGTEINDFNTSAGNLLYPGLGSGQTEPGQGEAENGVNENVGDPYANFLNQPPNFATDFANLDFNNETLYPDGIARITITRVSVPESSTTVGLIGMGGVFLLGASLRRRHPSC